MRIFGPVQADSVYLTAASGETTAVATKQGTILVTGQGQPNRGGQPNLHGWLYVVYALHESKNQITVEQNS